jgi:hypothetical protein
MVQIQEKHQYQESIKSSQVQTRRGGSSKIFSANAKKEGTSQRPKPIEKRHRVIHPKRNSLQRVTTIQKKNETSKSLQETRKPPFHPHTKAENHFGANNRETQMYQMYAQHKAQIQKSRKSRTVRRDRRKRKHIANKSPWDHAAQSWWEQSGIIGEQI